MLEGETPLCLAGVGRVMNTGFRADDAMLSSANLLYDPKRRALRLFRL